MSGIFVLLTNTASADKSFDIFLALRAMWYTEDVGELGQNGLNSWISRWRFQVGWGVIGGI
ncbi:hypothetical protein A2U01_0044969, partial [Trifolium medium]|nr:hypothetical protein [Trifolium medium]